MELDTSLHNDQAEPCARNGSNIPPALKRVKKPFLVILQNADPVVDNFKLNLRSEARNSELHGGRFVGILHCVGQQICEDVTEEPLIEIGFIHFGIDG